MSGCLSLSCSVGEELRLGLAGARLPMAANSSLLLPLPLLASHRFEGAAAERPPVRSMRATKVTSLVESSAALSRGFLTPYPTPERCCHEEVYTNGWVVLGCVRRLS